jgi:parvulin-like peptidyl-prolyl isomerase
MIKTTTLLLLLGVAAPFAAAAASDDPPPASIAAPPSSTAGLFTNDIVARGKGISLTRSQLDEEIIRVKSTLAAQGRPAPDDPLVIEKEVLNNLLYKQLLLAKATDADKAKGKEQFLSTIQKYKSSGKITDEEFSQRINQQLRILGLTRQQWEAESIDQSTLPIVAQRELNVTATDEQVTNFYNENPAKFEQPEMVRAAHILLLTTDPATRAELSDDQKAKKKQQLEDILKRARAGEDFAKLAKEYSEDPGSKDKGGEYTFPRGQMTPEFEAAAFSLNTNQISDIVTTPYGYHIIKLYEKIPAKKIAFDKVAADIHDYLIQQQVQKQLPGLLEKLAKEAKVEVLDPKLRQVPDIDIPASSFRPGPATPEKK